MNLEEQFNKYHPKIKAMAKRYSMSTGIPPDTFESAMCEGLWKAVESYDPCYGTNIESHIFSVIKKLAINVIRSKYGMSWRVTSYFDDIISEDEQGENAVDILAIADANTEDSVLKPTKKDKLQLINQLIKGSDEFTIAVVDIMLSTGESVRGVGRMLGVHHSKPDRALKNLHDRYDEKKFGDYHSYIA